MKGFVKTPVIPSGYDFRIVKNNETLDDDGPLLFTFSNFKMSSVAIDGFNDNAIENFLEGADIYQLEIPFENGASRVVFQKIDNLISFLFLDPNHHIYLNKKIVDGNGSLFFEFCPVNENDKCERMN